MDGISDAPVNASEIPDGFSAQEGGGSKAAEANAEKQQILEQICDPAAFERLQRIKLVKKDKAEAVENYLVQMAQNGSLQSKVTEGMLTEMLTGAGAQSKVKVTVQRRNYGIDSDDDDNDDDLM